MIARKMLPLAAWLLLAAPSPAPGQGTAVTSALCKAGEEVIFACRTRSKHIAVCGGGVGASRYAQYRFGTPGRLDLAHPARADAGAQGMSYAEIPYSGGGEAQVNFETGGYRYTVFSRMIRTGFGADGRNNPKFESGVAVQRGGKPQAQLNCVPFDSGNVDLRKAEKYLPHGDPVDLP